MAEQTETPGEKERTWFQARIHSWTWHATHSKWPFRNGTAAEKPSFFHKMKPLLALIPTTILSSALAYGIGRAPFIDHEFYNFVADHRSTTQAVLNFLTNIFGVWHLFRPEISNQFFYKKSTPGIRTSTEPHTLEMVEGSCCTQT